MTKKYKVIYDEKHQYYKTVPDIQIPEMFKKDITIDYLCWDCDFLYCNVPVDHINENIGLYHIWGKQAFNDTPQDLENVIKIYEKPAHERRLAMRIIYKLMEYTVYELKEAVPELFYPKSDADE